MKAPWQKWMPFDIQAFMSSPVVQAMHPVARSGYIYLLGHMWQTEGCSLPGDYEDLMIYSGIGPDLWAEHAKMILRNFVRLDNGHVQNAVLHAKWVEARDIYEKGQRQYAEFVAVRSAAGKAGATKRWHASAIENDSSAIAQPCDSYSSAIAQPSLSYSSAIAQPSLSHAFANGKPMANDSFTGTGTETKTVQEQKQEQILPAAVASGDHSRPQSPDDGLPSNPEPSAIARKGTALPSETPKVGKPTSPASPARPRASDADPRHHVCRGLIEANWAAHNPAMPQCPWDGSDAAVLSRLLAANPKLSEAGFAKLLDHRARSEVNLAGRPREWLGSLTNYAAGPLDKYNKPLKEQEHGNTANGRIKRAQSAFVEAARRSVEREAGLDAGPVGRSLPAPGHG